jgi:CheY-like chemotaxis protein
MCHVLIIEDEVLVALDIEDILAREGATSFDFADTEAAAVAAAEAHRPDIMTVDVILKSGFGPSAVEKITQLYGPIPTIFITGTPEGCPLIDEACILPKPVNEAAVVRAYHALQAA